MKITANFNNITGTIKPMHAVGQPPMTGYANDTMFHYLTEASIPYSRLHDMGGITEEIFMLTFPIFSGTLMRTRIIPQIMTLHLRISSLS